jgi:hypothetical protein
VVIFLKRLVRGSWPAAPVFLSVVLICGGSIVAGLNDLDSSVASYMYAGERRLDWLG